LGSRGTQGNEAGKALEGSKDTSDQEYVIMYVLLVDLHMSVGTGLLWRAGRGRVPRAERGFRSQRGYWTSWTQGRHRTTSTSYYHMIITC